MKSGKIKSSKSQTSNKMLDNSMENYFDVKSLAIIIMAFKVGHVTPSLVRLKLG